MKSRDLVYQTLEFNRPERVPRDLWLLPWATNQHAEKVRQIRHKYPDDFGGPPVQYADPIHMKSVPIPMNGAAPSITFKRV